PGERKVSIKRSAVVKFTQDQKKDAVIELCTREGSAAAVADRLGTCRYSLYKWKKELLGEEDTNMSEPGKFMLPDDRDALLAEVDSLKKQIYRQQMELDILNKAVEIIKKDQGIDPRKLTNKEKVSLIDALRERYPLNELLKMMGIPKSSYFYQKKAQTRPDKYAALRTNVKKIFTENQSRYGYRRVYAIIRNNGTIISEKVIRRIMKEEQLIVPFKRKRRYSSYKGEISPAVENLVDRDFHANTPNTKWLTDLTEFHIPAGKVYLSPIIDCFDGLVVSWTIGTSPDAELVNTMLDDAICNLTDGEHPIIHSDRGCHYRWPGWVSRMENAGLTRSMSKKGCSPDNSACEGFFGRLKNEMFYYRSWKDVSVNQFIDKLDNYLRWYNEKRIKMSLGAMSPVDYRRSIGLAV
ncbi:MAG: IS3 family transposase, partial [Clostridiales bacterium]|nr:IS3 family transposase [Clostridiales bacterium]